MLLKASDFLRVLDLRPEYGQCDASKPKQLRELAVVVSRKISKLELLPGEGVIPLLNGRQRQLADLFHSMSADRYLSADRFNVSMTALLNWATTPVASLGNRCVCQIILEDE